jgi:hypothetical protein
VGPTEEVAVEVVIRRLIPDSVSNDAQGLWKQFTDWLSKRF